MRLEKKVRAIKEQMLANALADLVARINRGAEFPDAAWSVSQLHAVNQSELEAEYDSYCIAQAVPPCGK